MAPEALLAFLQELAEESGLRVRRIGASLGPSGELVARSGICRLRDGVFVILVESESLEDRIEIVAEALRRHCRSSLEGRYLPPAVRERLEASAPGA